MTSLSDFPCGSKSEPPTAADQAVRAFAKKICSNPRNLMMPRFTEKWNREAARLGGRGWDEHAAEHG